MVDVDVMKAQIVRRDASEPWGFRLQGGVDLDQPLTIVRLTPGSPAARIGLRTGDEILEIASASTTTMTHQQALDLIGSHPDTLLLTVERRVSGGGAAAGAVPGQQGVTVYNSPLPAVPGPHQAPPRGYQPMDMTGASRSPPAANSPSVQIIEVDASQMPASRSAADSAVPTSTATYDYDSQSPSTQFPINATAPPAQASVYLQDSQPDRQDKLPYTSPPPRHAEDEWMACPQSRTFKILQSVMHNEEPAAGAAGLPPPRSAAMEQMKRERQTAGGQRVKVFMPQQYNSPMGMYSAHNVLETFTQQAESMLDSMERRQVQSQGEEHSPVHSTT